METESDSIWDWAEAGVEAASDTSSLADILSTYNYGSTPDELKVFQNLVNFLWSNDYAAGASELSGKYWDNNV